MMVFFFVCLVLIIKVVEDVNQSSRLSFSGLLRSPFSILTSVSSGRLVGLALRLRETDRECERDLDLSLFNTINQLKLNLKI